MKILLLLPVIIYIALAFFNLDLLKTSDDINIFNLVDISVPALLYSSIFLILYAVLIIVLFDLKGVFTAKKIDKLENEVFTLKSKLYDDREDELKSFISEYKTNFDNFTKSQSDLFEKIKGEYDLEFTKQKAENDKILEKLNLVDKSVLDKIKDTFKGNKN